MLWSLLKVVVFIAVAAALAYGASYLLDTPGQVVFAFAGREFTLTPLGFLLALAVLFVAVLLILKIIGFLVALVRFVLGDETALSRRFDRSRERRGLDALSGSMLALASGEGDLAARRAAKAEKLLRSQPITRLVRAQAAELNGDRATALDQYKAMLSDERTRLAGISGALRLKLDEGDTDTALELAKKAFALQPANGVVQRTLFGLQSKKKDWTGARETLAASMRARLLPGDVIDRRDAVLLLADARKALSEGYADWGHEAAKQANKLAPTLVPAAVLASEAYMAEGSKRRAGKVLAAAWTANPHPDLAAAFAAIEPGESPAARRKRFETLVSAAPASSESRLLAAELALAEEDFPAARKALGDLAEKEPTTRSLAVMAAIERGQGAPEAVVRGWLAKALGASRGPQWVCDKCSHVPGAWSPVCENCDAFDTLTWRTPPHAEDAGIAQSTMLPLIVGDPQPPASPAHDAPDDAAPAGEAERRTPPVVEEPDLAAARTG